MDVSASASGSGAPAPAASEQQPVAQDVAGGQQSVPQQQSSQSGNQSGALTNAIAKLFGSSSSPAPVPLHVSYRVDGHDIVTIFSDPKTGKEIAQFPPELLLGLAQFFDHQAGVTLDQKA